VRDSGVPVQRRMSAPIGSHSRLRALSVSQGCLNVFPWWIDRGRVCDRVEAAPRGAIVEAAAARHCTCVRSTNAAKDWSWPALLEDAARTEFGDARVLQGSVCK